MSNEIEDMIAAQRADPGDDSDLVSSERIEGTRVYNLSGERLGSIQHFIINVIDGSVRFAVISIGGILGLGSRYYPVPWDSLKYEVAHAGYVVDLDRKALRAARSREMHRAPAYDITAEQPVVGIYQGL